MLVLLNFLYFNTKVSNINTIVEVAVKIMQYGRIVLITKSCRYTNQTKTKTHRVIGGFLFWIRRSVDMRLPNGIIGISRACPESIEGGSVSSILPTLAAGLVLEPVASLFQNPRF